MSLIGQKTTTTSMNWEDFKSLISKLERDNEFKFCLLIAVGVFTGLRISDLLKLRFNQFENTEILTIQEQKTKKTRRIKINTDLKEIVERIRCKWGFLIQINSFLLIGTGLNPLTNLM
jgi:integrase